MDSCKGKNPLHDPLQLKNNHFTVKAGKILMCWYRKKKIDCCFFFFLLFIL